MDGATKRLTTDASVAPGETMQLDQMLFDVSDRVLDLLALLDNLRRNLQPTAVGTHEETDRNNALAPGRCRSGADTLGGRQILSGRITYVAYTRQRHFLPASGLYSVAIGPRSR